jgi:hypothetical protein
MFNDGFPLGIFLSNVNSSGFMGCARKPSRRKRSCTSGSGDGGDDGFVQLYYHLIGQSDGARKREPSVVQKLRVAEFPKVGRSRKSGTRCSEVTAMPINVFACRKPEVEESVDVENGT